MGCSCVRKVVCNPLLVAAALSAYALGASLKEWNNMPDQVPIHWDIDGRPNSWGPKAVPLVLHPVLGFAVASLIWFFFQRDPFFPSMSHLSKAACGACAVLPAAFLLGIHLLSLRTALSADQVLPVRALAVLMGAVLIILGHMLTQVERNHVAGIRTRWALGSKRCWDSTHAFTGNFYALMGFLVEAVAWWTNAGYVLASVVLVAFLLPAVSGAVYSYCTCAELTQEEDAITGPLLGAKPISS